MTHDRQTEIARYVACYQDSKYAMGAGRKLKATAVLKALPVRGFLLDVGAGRGELRTIARQLGFDYAGVDPVPYLAVDGVHQGVATDLPFSTESFDVVCCLDVLEHLVEADIVPALKEMRRVAKSHIFLTASEKPSYYGSPDGKDLHISKRPLAEWEKLFDEQFPFAGIQRLGPVGVSPGWLIEL